MKISSAEFINSIYDLRTLPKSGLFEFVFVGRSNVGKSSLINCLLRSKDLVKSGKKPGKTQEINFFLVNKSVYFVDLPGYGFAKMDLEKREQMAKMIQWYFFEKVYKRKAVLVLDMKVGPTDLDLEMFRILKENDQDILVVANKVDVLNQKERSAQIKQIAEKMPGVDVVPCSAKTEEGRTEVLKKIFE